MPRFFFDIDDGEHCIRDDDGTELQGVQEACHEAIRVLPDIARDILPGGDQRKFVAIVRNENDQLILKVTLSITAEWLMPPNVQPMPKTTV